MENPGINIDILPHQQNHFMCMISLCGESLYLQCDDEWMRCSEGKNNVFTLVPGYLTELDLPFNNFDFLPADDATRRQL